MLTNAIKQSKAYKAFIDYSIGLVLPKKTRGKCSKGKHQEVTTKKKTVITIDDNIITDDLDVAFELGNSISKTDAKIADETRHVHDTHACVVTEKAASGEESKESNGELAHRVTGIQVMTVEEQFAADTKKAMKASKKANREATRTLQQSGGSSEGAEESDKSDKNVDDIPWVSTSDEVEKGHDDNDRTMTDIEKNVAKKTEEQGDEEQAKEAQDDDDDQDQKDQADDDIIGTLFLNLSSGVSLVGTNKETTDAEINSLLDRKRRHEDKDEDPYVESDQGKKKRKLEDKFESSKKSSTSMEYSKDKTPPKTSKTRKSIHAEETVEEATHEVEMDVEEPT
ncbi:hypothetical protein Tco_1533641 [Tanacetum coccineum]